MPRKLPRFGTLLPQYNFFLNPYNDQRFTRCPQCDAKMGQKKLPLVINIHPDQFVSINYTCRYCKRCDLLVAHQGEIEGLLTAMFSEHDPKVIGNKYLVLGTFDHAYWNEGMKIPHMVQNLPANLHDFKQVLKFELSYGWVKDKPAPGPRQPDSLTRHEPLPSPNSRIVDDLDQALALVALMKAELPIRVRPTRVLIKVLQQRGVNFAPNQALSIRSVFYAGDEGGITCDITPSGQSKQAILCSLTHLEIEDNGPLTKEMRAYQQMRSAQLARELRSLYNFPAKLRSRNY